MLALSFSLSLSLSLSPSLCFSVPRCRSLPQPPSVHSAGSMYILYPWVNTFILMHACAHYTGVRVRARMQIGAFDRVGAKSHPWRHSKIPFFGLALFIFPPLTLFSRLGSNYSAFLVQQIAYDRPVSRQLRENLMSSDRCWKECTYWFGN